METLATILRIGSRDMAVTTPGMWGWDDAHYPGAPGARELTAVKSAALPREAPSRSRTSSSCAANLLGRVVMELA